MYNKSLLRIQVNYLTIIITITALIKGLSCSASVLSPSQWKTDINRAFIENTNEVLQPAYHVVNPSYDETRKVDLRPRHRFRHPSRGREHNYARKRNNRLMPSHRIAAGGGSGAGYEQSNEIPNMLNPREYPPNWTGGYYKYHQEGQINIPYKGAAVNVPIDKGNHRAHRTKIITTVIKPGDEWKYQNYINQRQRATPLRKRNMLRRNHADPAYLKDDSNNLHKRCILCPEERTLIANKKRDKVFFVKPKLKSCHGHALNSLYDFKSIYGVKPGDLLSPGTHSLVGEIYFKSQIIQRCHLRVNVIVQRCESLPKRHDLIAECDAENLWGSQCTFNCADSNYELNESANELVCNDDLKWVGEIPSCKQKTNSCEIPLTDLHTQLLCNTSDTYSKVSDLNNTEPLDSRLPEGTRCKFECERGYRSIPRGSSAVCIRGEWHGNLHVSCKRRRRNVQRSLG